MKLLALGSLLALFAASLFLYSRTYSLVWLARANVFLMGALVLTVELRLEGVLR